MFVDPDFPAAQCIRVAAGTPEPPRERRLLCSVSENIDAGGVRAAATSNSSRNERSPFSIAIADS
jgi:hypothetical protein